MSDDDLREVYRTGYAATGIMDSRHCGGLRAVADAVERAAQAAAFREAAEVCEAEAAGFRESKLWQAVAGIQACIKALRARAEGDGEGGR